MRIAYTFNLQTEDSPEQAEYDPPDTVELIAKLLTSLGHLVQPIDVSVPVTQLIDELKTFEPDIIFNTAEGAKGKFREGFYPGLFEQLDIPYTGSDAYVTTLTLDKGLTKLVLDKYHLQTPRWEFVDQESDIQDITLDFPVIIKPNFEGSSRGIDQDSVVTTTKELQQRIKERLHLFPDGLLIEEYIEGTDISVPFLENPTKKNNGVLLPFEYKIDKSVQKQRKFNIYDYQLKHELDNAVKTHFLSLPDEQILAIQNTSRKIFHVLQVRDIGRIDFRLTADGELFFIEVNALPSLQPDAGLYASAQALGYKHPADVLETIIRHACARQQISYSVSESVS